MSSSDRSRTAGGLVKLYKDHYIDHKVYTSFFEINVKSPLIHIYCINYEQKVGHIQTIFSPFCQIGNTIAISETIITSLCDLMDSISLVHHYVTRQDRVWIVNDKLVIVQGGV